MNNPVPGATDQTDLRHVLVSSLKIGFLVSALVALFSVTGRMLDGMAEQAVQALLVAAGIWSTTMLPGLWTRARSIEGIAGAASIGLAGTVVFLLVDVSLLQPLGVYSNRWLEIGGGSNWWYHPVWWMVGTFLPWMGAFALANQAARGREPSAPTVFITAAVLALVVGGLAAMLGFPGATLGVGTMGVAFLPAIALTVLVTGLGARRA